MAALHVIGIDFKLWLAVHFRFFGKQQRLVHLIAIGLLRFTPHQDLALKNAARLPRQNCLAGLPTGAIRRRMIQRRGGIHQRAACGQLRRVHVAGCFRPGQRRMDFHARKPGTSRNRHGIITRLGRDAGMDHGKMKRRITFGLCAAMGQHRAFRQINFKNRIVQILRAATYGRFQQSQRRASAKADQMAWMKGKRAARINGDGKQFQMPAIHAGRHIQQQPIFKHQRIQRGHGVFGLRRQGAQHPFQRTQMLRHRRRAIAKPSQHRKISAKPAIHKHRPRRAARRRQRQRAFNRGQRLSKTRLRYGRQIGVFPSLNAPRREATRRHMGRCIRAQRCQPRQPRTRQMILEALIAREETRRAWLRHGCHAAAWMAP